MFKNEVKCHSVMRNTGSVGLLSLFGRIVKTAIALSAFVLISFGQVNASETLEENQIPIPRLEKVKSDLANGRYENFFSFVGRFTNYVDEGQGNADALRAFVPDGFVSYSTVLSERFSSELIQEIVVFETHDAQPFFLFWVASKFRGNWEVFEYQVSSEFSEISGLWK